MSEEQGRKSHALEWALCTVAIPVVYMLSVPWVAIFTDQPRGLGAPPPKWCIAYCEPWDWAMHYRPLSETFGAYAQWCWKVSGHKLFTLPGGPV